MLPVLASTKLQPTHERVTRRPLPTQQFGGGSRPWVAAGAVCSVGSRPSQHGRRNKAERRTWMPSLRWVATALVALALLHYGVQAARYVSSLPECRALSLVVDDLRERILDLQSQVRALPPAGRLGAPLAVPHPWVMCRTRP